MYIKDVFSDEKINRIESTHIVNFKECLKSLKKKNGKPYAPETINKIINILCDIFSFGCNTLKIMDPNQNPMIGIKREKITYKKKITWTDEQINCFLSSDIVKSSHYYEMFCVSIMLGCRPGEVCGLSESDFNNEDKTLAFYRGINKFSNFSDLKNFQSHRANYIPKPLRIQIQKKLVWKKEMRLKYPDFFNNDALFVTESGGYVNPNYYSQQFRRTLREYNLRHTFASLNYSHGEQDKVLSSIMGNSVKTFLQNYAHIRGEQEKKTLESFSDSINISKTL
ncbi:MAG: hypothetical protein PHD70_13665 [Anaerostipes sp.]|nr:hypothetical protein [Anaerostipes sp.]MDD3747503.1 hypothetical protein [Anaerostipes sp.]